MTPRQHKRGRAHKDPWADEVRRIQEQARGNVWDAAAAMRLTRGGEALDPGVNYFVLMLDQLGLPTRFSCEGHPGGFYVTFEAPYEQALALNEAGFFTVEIEGPQYWSIRLSTPHDETELPRTMRWAAQAWEKAFGPLDFDAVKLDV